MYIVLEIQTLSDGSIGIPAPQTYETINEAEARFHTILSVAASSEIPMHSAMVITPDGMTIRGEHYEHKG